MITIKTKDFTERSFLKPNTVYIVKKFERDFNNVICFPIKLEGVSIQIDGCDLIMFTDESIEDLDLYGKNF